MLFPLRTFGAGLLGFVFLSSCATQPVEEVVDKPAEKIVPESKPVEIAPSLKKKGSSTGIGVDEFFLLQQSGDALIYDVRTPYFYNIDHIDGAINWPHTSYDEQVQERDLEIQKAMNDNKKIVLYCFNIGCAEARNVARKLARRDYDVYVLTMGIDSWRNAGLPLVDGAGQPTQ
ncbi:rhodanese-like domain-containing protein [Luteolibacter sp. AS25]|uniref:rhodanese-like domain-containing protein n=1 Tax=Luteolibacter sp. AS25 TaxID=3135776 RepID=UPI00398B6EEE